MKSENSATPSDEELFECFAQSRDEKAFSELVKRYQHFAFRVALSRCRCNELAEDAAQEAFLRLARSSDPTALKKYPSFKAWFFGLITNVARSRDRAEYRHRSREQRVKESAMRMPSARGGVGMDASSEDLRGVIERAIRNLDEPIQLAVVMYYIENLSQHEIGRLLRLSQPVVARRIQKGLELLRTHLVQAGYGAYIASIPSLLKTPHLLSAPPGLQGVLSQSGFLERALSQESLGAASGTVLQSHALKIAVLAALTLAGAGAWQFWKESGQPSQPPGSGKPAEAPSGVAEILPAHDAKASYHWSFRDGPASELRSKTGIWTWVARSGSKPAGMLTDSREMTAVLLPITSTKGKCWIISTAGYPLPGANLLRGEHAMPDDRQQFVHWGAPQTVDFATVWTDTYVRDNIEVAAIYQGTRNNLIGVEVLKKEATLDELFLTVKGFIVCDIEVREIGAQDIPEPFRDPQKLIDTMKLPETHGNGQSRRSP